MLKMLSNQQLMMGNNDARRDGSAGAKESLFAE